MVRIETAETRQGADEAQVDGIREVVLKLCLVDDDMKSQKGR